MDKENKDKDKDKDIKDIKNVIKLFKKHNPSKSEVKELGLTLKMIGKGLFRKAYRVNDLPLILKTPRHGCAHPDYDSEMYHMKQEVERIRDIKKSRRFRPFRRYLPDILYFNKDTGVLLMPEYEKVGNVSRRVVSDILSNLSYDLNDGSGSDLHDENIRYDPTREGYVIIDLGYF